MQITDLIQDMGGLAAMLDANGDGNPFDDIMGMADRVKR